MATELERLWAGVKQFLGLGESEPQGNPRLLGACGLGSVRPAWPAARPHTKRGWNGINRDRPRPRGGGGHRQAGGGEGQDHHGEDLRGRPAPAGRPTRFPDDRGQAGHSLRLLVGGVQDSRQGMLRSGKQPCESSQQECSPFAEIPAESKHHILNNEVDWGITEWPGYEGRRQL